MVLDRLSHPDPLHARFQDRPVLPCPFLLSDNGCQQLTVNYLLPLKPLNTYTI